MCTPRSLDKKQNKTVERLWPKMGENSQIKLVKGSRGWEEDRRKGDKFGCDVFVFFDIMSECYLL